jgi:hypothetical protein
LLFWVVTPCGLVGRHHRFGGTYCHHLQAWRQYEEVLAGSIIRVIMMEAASTSETSVNFYRTIRRNIPKDNRLHTRRRENLKSHMIFLLQPQLLLYILWHSCLCTSDLNVFIEVVAF